MHPNLDLECEKCKTKRGEHARQDHAFYFSSWDVFEHYQDVCDSCGHELGAHTDRRPIYPCADCTCEDFQGVCRPGEKGDILDEETSKKAGARLTCWELLDTILAGDTYRSLLHGPPGTGKTTAYKKWADANGWELISMTMTEEMAASELRGYFMLKGNEFVWHDGFISRAFRMSHDPNVKGVVILVNEVDHTGPDAMTFLHNALDDPELSRLYLPTDEVLTPAPGKIRFGATMNGLPADLPEAVADRFPVAIYTDQIHPDAMRKLPKKLRKHAHSCVFSSQVERRVGFRKFLALAQLLEQKELPEREAFQAVFGGRSEEMFRAIKLADAPGSGR